VSGLQRDTYEQWFKSRGDLFRLLSPEIIFTRLLIGHWDHAAGKSGKPADLKKMWEKVADGVAVKTNELPENENVLYQRR
jgi:hypothetical protein